MLDNNSVKEKFKDVELLFSHYYKYVFYYTGKSEDGYSITTGFGGCNDDIYRHEVCNNDAAKLGEFEYEWMSVEVYKDKERVFYYSDW